MTVPRRAPKLLFYWGLTNLPSGRFSRLRPNIWMRPRIPWTGGQNGWQQALPGLLAAPRSFPMMDHPTLPSCVGQNAAVPAGHRPSACWCTKQQVCSSATARRSPCRSGLGLTHRPMPPAQTAMRGPARTHALSVHWHRINLTMSWPARRICGLPKGPTAAPVVLSDGPAPYRSALAAFPNNPLSTCAHFWESDVTHGKAVYREKTDPDAPCQVGLVGSRR